ncbi:Lipoate-protein ligase A [Ceraceosorus bombacis]|uniref:Putative lipoate-protein ligase A n=1 Tax=Ceraceosorus bombacis TaxID=401625 RepID=A0A0P1BAZ3_9BASI|nr:Lipoate-protein ligase A [Ceraceosorus bombacis]
MSIDVAASPPASLAQFTDLKPSPPTPNAQAYFSRCFSPTFNLSLEEHLFRTRPSHIPVCLIYRISPCVVLGRNQNPWKELDVLEMRRLELQWVRRRSGGGAVYHDLGNVNYSFHVDKADFVRSTHSELVVRALNAEPIGLQSPQPGSPSATEFLGTQAGAYVNGRNDICVRVRLGGGSDLSANDGEAGPATPEAGGDESQLQPELLGAERKVSGSAYKLINARAYHHGTMLLSAQLSTLGSSLRPIRGEALQSKGVASVPSPVVNLCAAYPHRAHALDLENFEQGVLKEFERKYGTAKVQHVEEDHALVQDERFLKGREEMKSWQWTHGQTPEFTHDLRYSNQVRAVVDGALRDVDFTLHLHVKGGLVQQAKLDIQRAPSSMISDALGEMATKFVDVPYDVLASAPRREGGTTRHAADLRDPQQVAKALEQEAERSLEALGYKLGDLYQPRRDVLLDFVRWLKSSL